MKPSLYCCSGCGDYLQGKGLCTRCKLHHAEERIAALEALVQQAFKEGHAAGRSYEAECKGVETAWNEDDDWKVSVSVRALRGEGE